MSRSQVRRGRNKEVKAHIQICSDSYIKKLLEVTHKNTDDLRLFSDQMVEMGVILNL